MTAEAIIRALDARKCGSGWMARCPVHQDRTPSLSICESDDGAVLLFCHAGCDTRDIIEILKSRGLWRGLGSRSERSSGARLLRRPDKEGASRRTAAATSLWQTSRPPYQTPVDVYLTGRGLRLPAAAPLRFHAALRHPSGGPWAGMVALVTSGVDDLPLGVHRTFLTPSGDSKAPINPNKMMLGPCRGGAVKLGGDGHALMVGEGIETCLAAMTATGLPAWAALSTSGLRTLDLPEHVTEVVVLADGDPPGEAAAQVCGRRWRREGRRVRIARPPTGMDFNDMLIGQTARIEEEAL